MASHDSIVLQIRSAPSVSADRLDRWLADRLAALPDSPDLSRTRIKALIQDGHVSAGEETIVNPDAPVKPDRLYQVRVPGAVPATPQPEALPFGVVHEDDDLIVIDKPAGMPVHPAPGSPAGTLVNALLAHCGDRLSGIGGVLRPGIVHRLDKDTTGLMVVAKNDSAHHRLAHQFAARSITRTYLAVIWGVPDRAEGRVEGPIGRSRRNRKKMAVVGSGGKPAATRYRLIERYHGAASLVECRLESGRTHQIRVHMTHIGHPVVGDPLYGSGERRKGITPDQQAATALLGRQALHANTLAFTHPRSGEPVAFTREPPPAMARLIEVFRNATKKS